jgi:DNA ligase-1
MNYKDAVCAALWDESITLFENKEARRAVALRKSRKIFLALDTITCADDVKHLAGIGAGTIRRLEAVIASTKTLTTTTETTQGSAQTEIKKEVIVVTGLFVLMLAESWNKLQTNPIGWWMSEKLDGIRCRWDGTAFYTRAGNLIDAPGWVIDQMPNDELDGELWCGRGKFDICMGIKSNAQHKSWTLAKFHVFDVLKVDEVFETRKKMVKEIAATVDFIVSSKNEKCKSREHLLLRMKQIVDAGGEGVMLRQPGSKYEGRRSKTMQKCKPEYDAEAEVIGHVEDKASLLMKMENGITFKLSTLKKPKEDFPIGTIITYKFNELYMSGKPKFAVMLRVRKDATKAKDFEF